LTFQFIGKENIQNKVMSSKDQFFYRFFHIDIGISIGRFGISFLKKSLLKYKQASRET
jgi:hypothetical protein